MSDEIILSEKNSILSLYLNNNVIQSSMSLKEPSQLLLSYSQAMLSPLLFLDTCHSILHLGLGGGSLVRWFDKFYPDCQQTAVEINPEIVSIAYSMFLLSKLNKPIEIIIEDAFYWLLNQTSNQFDLIFVDIFNGNGMIAEFVSKPFFETARDKISSHGCVVFNWWQNYPYYAKNLRDLKEVFSCQVLECPAKTHGNIAVLGFKENIPLLFKKQIKKKAEVLSLHTNVDFLELLKAVK